MSNRDGITTMVSDRTGRTTYRARISFTDHTGQRRHRSKSFRTKKAAESWRRQQLTALDTGAYHEPPPVTLGEVATRWLDTIDRGRAASTYLQYATTYRKHVAPRFGDRKLAGIRATDVQAFYDELGKTYKAETVKGIHTVLRGIVGHAIADGLVTTNVTDNRRLPRNQRDEPTIWTPDEVRTFLAHIDPDDDALIFQVMLATGMRLGETLGLQWDAVDLDGGTIHVRRNLRHTVDGWVIADATKNDNSVRTVMLPARAVLALRRQQALDLPGDVVFSEGGQPRSPQLVRKQLDTLCAAAGVPRITPHGFRRICATLMARQGVHVNAAARQLGHRVETMLRLYAQVQPDMQVAAAHAMDTALSS